MKSERSRVKDAIASTPMLVKGVDANMTVNQLIHKLLNVHLDNSSIIGNSKLVGRSVRKLGAGGALLTCAAIRIFSSEIKKEVFTSGATGSFNILLTMIFTIHLVLNSFILTLWLSRGAKHLELKFLDPSKIQLGTPYKAPASPLLDYSEMVHQTSLGIHLHPKQNNAKPHSCQSVSVFSLRSHNLLHCPLRFVDLLVRRQPTAKHMHTAFNSRDFKIEAGTKVSIIRLICTSNPGQNAYSLVPYSGPQNILKDEERPSRSLSQRHLPYVLKNLTRRLGSYCFAMRIKINVASKRDSSFPYLLSGRRCQLVWWTNSRPLFEVPSSTFISSRSSSSNAVFNAVFTVSSGILGFWINIGTKFDKITFVFSLPNFYFLNEISLVAKRCVIIALYICPSSLLTGTKIIAIEFHTAIPFAGLDLYEFAVLKILNSSSRVSGGNSLSNFPEKVKDGKFFEKFYSTKRRNCNVNENSIKQMCKPMYQHYSTFHLLHDRRSYIRCPIGVGFGETVLCEISSCQAVLSKQWFYHKAKKTGSKHADTDRKGHETQNKLPQWKLVRFSENLQHVGVDDANDESTKKRQQE
ncbi:hypothetical protein P5673_029070 [Acropora cervicornis]|uniref:Uncharacterized protein n=1 Tax=Acropora cervicornis TaxID=6130 RepID=A0AAD9UUF6_ACRCE|nr:hypothetical protein P5673_029070 [Acropora cervicornis]